jgi:hypothetical protein
MEQEFIYKELDRMVGQKKCKYCVYTKEKYNEMLDMLMKEKEEK